MLSAGFFGQSLSVFTKSYSPWLTTIVVLLISSGSSILFLPNSENTNKAVRWYTFCIYLLEEYLYKTVNRPHPQLSKDRNHCNILNHSSTLQQILVKHLQLQTGVKWIMEWGYTNKNQSHWKGRINWIGDHTIGWYEHDTKVNQWKYPFLSEIIDTM